MTRPRPRPLRRSKNKHTSLARPEDILDRWMKDLPDEPSIRDLLRPIAIDIARLFEFTGTEDYQTLFNTPCLTSTQVARALHLNANTIRAMERRHPDTMPRPTRTRGGHRRYSYRDLSRIRAIREAGNRIR